MQSVVFSIAHQSPIDRCVDCEFVVVACRLSEQVPFVVLLLLMAVVTFP